MIKRHTEKSVNTFLYHSLSIPHCLCCAIYVYINLLQFFSPSSFSNLLTHWSEAQRFVALISLSAPAGPNWTESVQLGSTVTSWTVNQLSWRTYQNLKSFQHAKAGFFQKAWRESVWLKGGMKKCLLWELIFYWKLWNSLKSWTYPQSSSKSV